MEKKNYKVLYFYKNEDEKYIDDSVIVVAKDKDNAEAEARKILTVKIGISKVEEYEYPIKLESEEK